MPFASSPELSAEAQILEKALGGENSSARPEVQLRMHGGASSEALNLEVLVTSEGEAICSLSDELRGLERSERARVSQDRLNQLYETLRSDALLRLDASPPLLAPDSVLGLLTLSVEDSDRDRSSLEWYFVADEGQAQAAGEPVPSELAEPVASVLAVALDVLALDSIDPNLVGDPGDRPRNDREV